MPKFRRAAPADRKQALVAATLRCLKRYGHEGASVRRISKAAGVSIGLINHHFPSKTGLVAAAYETLALGMYDSLRTIAAAPRLGPRERLSAFFKASFAAEILDPQLFKVWIVFWSMAGHSRQIRAVHERTYAEYRAIIEGLLDGLTASGAAPRVRVKPAAIALTAMLDGLWIELSLNPSAFKPRAAIALCEDWVNAVCAGALPGLVRARR